MYPVETRIRADESRDSVAPYLRVPTYDRKLSLDFQGKEVSGNIHEAHHVARSPTIEESVPAIEPRRSEKKSESGINEK